MSLPATAYFPFTSDMIACRLLNGLWQLSGAHGSIDRRRAVLDMLAYHDAGFSTWDLADHYGPAEDFIGEFRGLLVRERGAAALAQMRAFTKWVPRPGAMMTRQVVEAAIDQARWRMGTETLDLLQFHWWDYSDPRYLDALKQLADLCAAGKIRHLALTNFDTERLRQISEAGIRVASNQVQYSLVDQRPMQGMAAFCAAQGIHLLTYGTVCGGLLAERWRGQPEPGHHQLNTASLRKYKQMIDAWGGWALFQALLEALAGVAEKHGVSLAVIATAAILQRPAVGGVIVGARLGLAEHRAENAQVFSVALDDADRSAIAAVTGQGRDLLRVIGDCGDEYRRR